MYIAKNKYVPCRFFFWRTVWWLISLTHQRQFPYSSGGVEPTNYSRHYIDSEPKRAPNQSSFLKIDSIPSVRTRPFVAHDTHCHLFAVSIHLFIFLYSPSLVSSSLFGLEEIPFWSRYDWLRNSSRSFCARVFSS